MILGYCTRINSEKLPPFIAYHFGDALWAAMIYCGFRVIGIHKKAVWALVCSAVFCLAIELSQLIQVGWIIEVRGTTLGGLILGKGFLYVDLIRYGCGILVIFAVDYLLIRFKTRIKLVQS